VPETTVFFSMMNLSRICVKLWYDLETYMTVFDAEVQNTEMPTCHSNAHELIGAVSRPEPGTKFGGWPYGGALTPFRPRAERTQCLVRPSATGRLCWQGR